MLRMTTLSVAAGYMRVNHFRAASLLSVRMHGNFADAGAIPALTAEGAKNAETFRCSDLRRPPDRANRKVSLIFARPSLAFRL